MPAGYRDDILEVLEEQFRDDSRVMRGLIFGHPGFKRINRVFCFVYADGLTLKLPPADYRACLELEEAEPFSPRGSPMGTWVVLSYPDAPEYLDNWQWVEKALAYIITDEAAPPKKKKKR
ncbi:MAG: hypothetical protein IH972_05890 [Candidatus Marinimicrobia bacterium]|nr:hypothetical protein [Candidatus Neomarinimicrobiota bacterium]